MDKNIIIRSGEESFFPVKVINKEEEAYRLSPEDTFKGAEMDSLLQAIRYTKTFMQNEANARLLEDKCIETPLPKTIQNVLKNL